MEITFENPLFLIPFSSGLIFVLAGFIMLKFPPKKINSFYGYRTYKSMKNQERWDFAQKYSSLEMIKLGGLLTLSSCLGFFYLPKEKTAMFIGLGLMILMVIILLFRVERAIQQKFGKHD
ncbi:MAG: hypothetical protein COB73_01045 [Flavobacteriaceae bacterium]|nr:MAG: hypothetical protein COB73_01045 [Flavobacteriaceae bacterium]